MSAVLDEIKIRSEIQPGDLGFMAYMHGKHYSYGMQFEVYVMETLVSFFNTMNRENERIWFAEHEGKVVGTIALKNTEGQAQLRYFLIEPGYRGIGLGKKLTGAFMAFMQQSGYRGSFLLTERSLETAAQLYKKLGYTYVGSQYTDFGLEEMRYELTT